MPSTGWGGSTIVEPFLDFTSHCKVRSIHDGLGGP
jgi:hypothetical protein